MKRICGQAQKIRPFRKVGCDSNVIDLAFSAEPRWKKKSEMTNDMGQKACLDTMKKVYFYNCKKKS